MERLANICVQTFPDPLNALQTQARIVGQAANSFIAVACPDGDLILIDQHAAHERVRLESLAAQVQIPEPRRLLLR